MKWKFFYLMLFAILASCTSGGNLEKMARERADLYFRSMVFARAVSKNINLDDFNIKNYEILLSNDSICAMKLTISVKEKDKEASESEICYAFLKDMSLSRIKGEDVYKEYSDERIMSFNDFKELMEEHILDGTVEDHYSEFIYNDIIDDRDTKVIQK